jgi:hypothetical protein
MIGPAVTQGQLPRPGPYDRLQVSVKNRGGQSVLDMHATLKKANIEGGFALRGRVRFSRRLCEAAYRMRFTFTMNRGRVAKFSYRARMRRGRLDGVARRCPFAGLPRSDLTSLHVRASIDRRSVLDFAARPSARRSSPTTWLEMPELIFKRSNAPTGLVRVRIRARYRSQRSHTVRFVADTGIR